MTRLPLLVASLIALAAAPFVACKNTTALSLPAGIPKARGVERAMWVTRFDYQTPHDIERIAECCQLAGMNTILFQVRGNATTSYHSANEPWAEQFQFTDPGFDPLATAIQAAHARGLQLKAWVNVVPAWWGTTPPSDPHQVWNAHKDWLWYDQNGKVQPLSDRFYVSLNPCLPEVRRYIADVLRDLVARYDLDGLHLDYLRFPNDKAPAGADYPRDARTVKLFRGETDTTPEKDKAKWDAWRTEQVTNLLREIRRQVRQERPSLELSAAVGPEPDQALHQHFQDARTWAHEKLVDALYPMSYAHDTAAFQRRVETWRGIAHDVPVVLGLRLDTGDVDLHQREIATALKEFRSYALFAYASLFDSPGDALEPQSEQARTQRQVRRTALLPMLKSMARGGASTDAE
jgi:uncharacterized lipoprotein YddW (UPF0748 family)